MVADLSPDVASILKDMRFDLIITEEDKAYAAGIIDGEGCISISRAQQKHSTGYSLIATVRMVDVGAILWLKRKFGGHIFYHKPEHKPERKEWLPSYIWTVHGLEAGEFCIRMLAYLKVKQKQAEIAIEFSKTLKDSTHVHHLTAGEREFRRTLCEAIQNLNQRRE